MGREDDDIRAAKLGYKEAARDGNHHEEARRANVIGDLHKRKGEYVKAMRWLRIDYEVSAKHLPQKLLLATCQSLGEVYLLLERFKEALLYQFSEKEEKKVRPPISPQPQPASLMGKYKHAAPSAAAAGSSRSANRKNDKAMENLKSVNEKLMEELEQQRKEIENLRHQLSSAKELLDSANAGLDELKTQLLTVVKETEGKQRQIEDLKENVVFMEEERRKRQLCSTGAAAAVTATVCVAAGVLIFCCKNWRFKN